jgi:hypothetical protein
MKKLWLLVLFIPAIAFAALKVWSTGEILTAADLNGNFAYIKAHAVGMGTHTLVNSDVSSSAAIAHSKLAVPSLVPKAWGEVYNAAPCAAAGSPDCTAYLVASYGLYPTNAIVGGGTAGLYHVAFATARADGYYAPVANSITPGVFCSVENFNTVYFDVRCKTSTSGAATDANFTFIVMDNL